MKYVMFEVSRGGLTRKVPVIFPDSLVHREVAGKLMSLLRDEFESVKVASAGSINSFDFGGTTHGGSETLKVASDPNDATLIKMYDYFGGVV